MAGRIKACAACLFFRYVINKAETAELSMKRPGAKRPFSQGQVPRPGF